ncbi:AraC family transcriptional regulator [Amphibacillus cookii]|uniref:AraC family transcriptional regulator n=1 Tax=Amphibacillus cookii TaxID=767787 RepID=UPI00195C638C|nr:AraC family transcriptional regulator [Amphibacillus cookii]MBM7540291.1 AraC-like DNA-binding protein/mannose-6-phosphate isomerase-like protein (cupin superfamily) [Amphibacillus cookii]
MSSLYQKLLMLTEEEEIILKQKSKKIEKDVYTSQRDFIIERAKFLSDKKLIVTRKHPRFIAFPAHRHDYIEINYVYHGSLIQMIDNQRFELKQGELLFLNQHIEHALEPCGEEDLVINFIIDPYFFEHMFDSLDIEGAEQSIVNFLISGLFNQNKAGSYLYYQVSDIEVIQSIIASMIEEMMNPTVWSEVTVKFQMGLLMIQLMKHADKAYTPSNRIYDHQLALAVMRYIDQHFKTAKLETIAEKLNMNSYNLSKYIKKTTGKTFKVILQERRLEEAKSLLNYTDLAVEHIATEIGYDNLSYFYRLFKLKFGCTPSVYRKALYKS